MPHGKWHRNHTLSTCQWLRSFVANCGWWPWCWGYNQPMCPWRKLESTLKKWNPTCQRQWPPSQEFADLDSHSSLKIPLSLYVSCGHDTSYSYRTGVWTKKRQRKVKEAAWVPSRNVAHDHSMRLWNKQILLVCGQVCCVALWGTKDSIWIRKTGTEGNPPIAAESGFPKPCWSPCWGSKNVPDYSLLLEDILFTEGRSLQQTCRKLRREIWENLPSWQFLQTADKSMAREQLQVHTRSPSFHALLLAFLLSASSTWAMF